MRSEYWQPSGQASVEPLSIELIRRCMAEIAANVVAGSEYVLLGYPLPQQVVSFMQRRQRQAYSKWYKKFMVMVARKRLVRSSPAYREQTPLRHGT